MAVSNRERVGRAFELLAAGLGPYVDRRMKAAAGDRWLDSYGEQGRSASLADPHVQLKVMAEAWQSAFHRELTRTDRNIVFELRDVRNKWAHNDPFSTDDTYRALDSIERLLAAVDANEAGEVGKSKDDLMRLRYEAEARKAMPKQDVIQSQPVGGLKPWRDIVFPHEDVARGRYALAEFAADLHQVHRGQGAAEYVDPVEFFQRTYLTAGLQALLVEAAHRLHGSGGVPVVNLQTNFGGGKTHSLIALYHLCSGLPLEGFPQEVQDVLHHAGISQLSPVQRAVLVGTKLSPGQPERKPDGTEVRTLWGELAWQLAGADGYAVVEQADRTATNPGDALRPLFEAASPCLILIDEWVAYARQLYADDSLPAGTFDTHFSFAQALTEAARTTDGALLVVSIPASEAPDGASSVGSDIEVGGTGGREALRRLRNVIGRVESSWRPASAEESFEIVRRRLFQPIDPARLPDRDATARVFGELYRSQAAEFPIDCRETAYVDRIKRAYPIHPEVFARLYEDWSTLDRFQRTRGVLRLMASVIHALWERGDQLPLILPASVPLDDTAVSAELTRNLEDNWKPVIDADVDGPESLPVALDRDFPNLGRYGAARRVARTVFLGSAPLLRSPNRGLDAARVRLGCALPGEAVATYGDALNRLSDRATYLYVEGARYWYGTQPGVARTAQQRAERYLSDHIDLVNEEIVRRLRPLRQDRGDFAGVHVAPAGPADIPDDPEARLVVLGPASPHVARSDDSPALAAAKTLLEQRGPGPRVFRNMVVFLAADQRRLEELQQGGAEFLAWQSIDREATELNLDPHQRGQAATKLRDSDQAVDLRLAEAYHWLLVPSQPDPTGPITWDAVKADGQGTLAVRAGRKLVNEGRLSVAYPAVLLRQQLDGVLASLWSDGDVTVDKVWDALARYLYLPRLRDIDVLIGAVRQGPASTTWDSEGFATADAVDEKTDRRLGLVAGAHPAVVTSSTRIVHPDVARAQIEAEPGVAPPAEAPGTEEEAPAAPAETKARRFYGAVDLDPQRVNRDFAKLAQEVIDHLTGLVGTNVRITVEIHAENPEGFPGVLRRIVAENAQTLRFSSHEFEES